MSNETRTFKLNTVFGVLNAQWLDAHNVYVRTLDPDRNYDYDRGAFVETPGKPLVVNGVAYSVGAYVHRSGCLTEETTGRALGAPSYCYEHRDGRVAPGDWTFGRVKMAAEYENRCVDGEVDATSRYPHYGKGGRTSGAGATSAACKRLDAAILSAVRALGRTVGHDAAYEAQAANLRQDIHRLNARAAALRAEADQCEAEAAEKGAELAGPASGLLAVSA